MRLLARVPIACLALVVLLPSRTSPAQGYAFTHLAGSFGGFGWTDGVGSSARFDSPAQVAVDASGFLYVADTRNHTIRRIQPATGVVTTVAGLAGSSGSADGTGSAARFSTPYGIAADDAGSLYVADLGNHTIRRIAIGTGEVTTLAGRAGNPGSADGTGSAARFHVPSGLVADGAGSLYVADTYNHVIRAIRTATAEVTTLAGLAGSEGSSDGTLAEARFRNPRGVAADASGDVYVADTDNHLIRKIALASGEVTTLAGQSLGSADGTGTAARFAVPCGIAFDGAGDLIVADTLNETLRRVTVAGGVVTTIAGLSQKPGEVDGSGSLARFDKPRGVVADGAGRVYVADAGGHTIRRVVVATADVTTLAGLAARAGSADGPASAARFRGPAGVVADGAGSLFVSDTGNHTIRRVRASTGEVTTLAGLAGSSGSADGSGSASRWNHPSGIAVDGYGIVYVADTDNHVIRQVVASTGEVTTLAGLAGSIGNVDGIGSAARFAFPRGIAADGAGNLYVADTTARTIRKVVAATGEVTTLAGLAGSTGRADGTGSAARFNYPFGIVAVGSDLFVADSSNQTIRKVVASTGEVTTLAGSAPVWGSADGTGSVARFHDPFGIGAHGGDLFVADTLNQAIRRVTSSTGVVSTVGGLAEVRGSADGVGSAARFALPGAITADATGILYVADTENNAIRSGQPPRRFFAVSPCRLVDTRRATGPNGGPALGPGQTRAFGAAPVCGLPVSARALSLNVTVTEPTEPGFVTLYAGDGAVPLASTLGFRAGQTRASCTMVPLSADGFATLRVLNGSTGSTHILLDVNGYFE